MRGRFSIERSLISTTRQKKVQQHMDRMDRSGFNAKQRVAELEAYIAYLRAEYGEKYDRVCVKHEEELKKLQLELEGKEKDLYGKTNELTSCHRYLTDSQNLLNSSMLDKLHLTNENQGLLKEVAILKETHIALENNLKVLQLELTQAREVAHAMESKLNVQVSTLQEQIRALEAHQHCMDEMLHPNTWKHEKERYLVDIDRLRLENTEKGNLCTSQQEKYNIESAQNLAWMEKLAGHLKTQRSKINTSSNGTNTTSSKVKTPKSHRKNKKHNNNANTSANNDNTCVLDTLVSPTILFDTCSLLANDQSMLQEHFQEEKTQYAQTMEYLKGEYEADLKVKNAQKEQLQVEYDETSALLRGIEVELNAAKLELQQLHQNIQLQEQANKVLQNILASKESSISSQEEQVRVLEGVSDEKQSTIHILETEVESLKNENTALQSTYDVLQDEYKEISGKEYNLVSQQSEQSVQLGDLHVKQDTLKQDQKDKMDEYLTLQDLHDSSVRTLEGEKDTLESSLSSETRKYKEKVFELDIITSDYINCSKKVEGQQEEQRQAKTERRAAEEDADECRMEQLLKSQEQSERVIALQAKVQECTLKLSHSEDALLRYQHEMKQQMHGQEGAMDVQKLKLMQQDNVLLDKEVVITNLSKQVDTMTSLKVSQEHELQALKRTIKVQGQEIELLHESIADSIEETSTLQHTIQKLTTEVDKKRKEISLLEFKTKELLMEAGSQKREYDMTIQEIESLAKAKSQRSGMDVMKDNVRLLNIATKTEQERAQLNETQKVVNKTLEAVQQEKNDLLEKDLKMARKYNTQVESYDAMSTKCVSLESDLQIAKEQQEEAQEELHVAEKVQDMLSSNQQSPSVWQKRYDDILKLHQQQQRSPPEWSAVVLEPQFVQQQQENTEELQAYLQNMLEQRSEQQEKVLSLEQEVQRVKDEMNVTYSILHEKKE